MKPYCIYIILFISTITNANDNGEDLIGFWLNETGEYIVEVYQKENNYYGKVVWLLDSLDNYMQPLRDVLNNNPQKRSRLVKGLDVLDGFEYEDGIWKSGVVYNYKTGSDYNGRLKVDDEGNLRLTGYYGILFFLGKTKVWTPIKDTAKFGLE